MSSNHGADTAKKMDEMRRDAKRKQERGIGAVKVKVRPVDFKEAATNMPRYFRANFAPATLGLFTNLMEEGKLVTVSDIDRIFKAGQVGVVLNGSSAKLVGMDGLTIQVTNMGFTQPDLKTPPCSIWGITVNLAGGYGVNFKWNDKHRCMVID
jgi:hypothetical protein